MIYFVDEDKNELEPYVYELEGRGYDCQILRNADRAYDVLVGATDIQVVVVDVMLATANARTSRFDAISTENFVTTGLKLIEELIANQPQGQNVFPSKAVFFSSARIEQVVSRIEKMSATYNIPYLDKNEFSCTPDFADALINHIDSI